SRLGVRPAMMPWLYTPMLAHPMSSPIMKMILGLCCCCASTGVLGTIAVAHTPTSRPSQLMLLMLMIQLLSAEDGHFAAGQGRLPMPRNHNDDLMTGGACVPTSLGVHSRNSGAQELTAQWMTGHPKVRSGS